MEISEKVIEINAGVNLKDKNGDSILMGAKYSGSSEHMSLQQYNSSHIFNVKRYVPKSSKVSPRSLI